MMEEDRALNLLQNGLLPQVHGAYYEALKMAIDNWQPKLSKDCISRQEAIDAADNLVLETHYDNEKVEEMLRELPPVTPEPKTGKWIKKMVRGSEELYCSNCGDGIDVIYEYDYCPNCGAKMEEGE